MAGLLRCKWRQSLYSNQADPATLLANLQGKAYYLAGFLAEEVLDRQPEEIRQFLLRSSILETLTGPLCEAVVNPDAQPGYGAVMLDRLEHAHLFITALDEKHEWFRYHPLFADFLRQIQAEVNPAEIPGAASSGRRCGSKGTVTWTKLFGMRWPPRVWNGRRI